jgi:mitochondrial fission protein ELM1
MLIWVLTDERIGSNNQSIALAEQLSQHYITKNIKYNNLIKLPNFIRRGSLLGINLKKSDDLNTNEYPDVLICAGRRLSSVGLNIKNKSQGKTFVINIMNPNLPYNKFDLILLPKHDDTKPVIKARNKNIIETNGSLNKVKLDRIDNEKAKWQIELEKMPEPRIGFIIGGDTKSTKFPAENFGKTTKQLSDLTKKLGGSLLITTSRRTSYECLQELKKNLDCKYYLYDWNDENTKSPEHRNPLGNPYFAYMGISDYLVVTGDSMSMVSEACSTGKPVYVYMPDSALGKKHKRFCHMN